MVAVGRAAGTVRLCGDTAYEAVKDIHSEMTAGTGDNPGGDTAR